MDEQGQQAVEVAETQAAVEQPITPDQRQEQGIAKLREALAGGDDIIFGSVDGETPFVPPKDEDEDDDDISRTTAEEIESGEFEHEEEAKAFDPTADDYDDGWAATDEEGNLVQYPVAKGEDGEVQWATKDELLQSYHSTSQFTDQVRQHTEQYTQAMNATNELAVNYTQKLQQIEQLLNESGPSAENVDWDRMADENPQLFAQEYRKHQAREAAKAKVAEAKRAEEMRLQNELQGKVEMLKQKELEMLRAAVPEWRDDNVARSEVRELFAMANKEFGFTQEELGNLTDHRSYLLLRAAQKGLEVQGKAKAAMSRVKAGTTLKPGSTVRGNRSQAQTKAQALATLTAKAKRSGDPRDAQAVMAYRIRHFGL